VSEIVPPLPLPSSAPSFTTPDALQFGRADFAGAPAALSCTSCQKTLDRRYFEVNGAVVCDHCRTQIALAANQGTPVSRFFRALAAGTLAGAAGSGVYFLISTLTGYEFGLVAILVGFAVGAAVKWGCYGRGGKPYQALAVALTYLAIVSTYVPQIIDELAKADAQTIAGIEAGADQKAGAAGQEPEAETVVAQVAAEAEPSVEAAPAAVAVPAGDAKPAEAQWAGPGLFLVAMVFIMLVACAAPFLAGIQNVVGILIIGFGLFEAWKMNKRQAVTITGPHVVGAARPVPVASAS
jgi:hypothetical protein